VIRRLLEVILLASLVLPLVAAERRVLFAILHDEKAIEPIVLLDPMAAPRDSNVFRSQPYILSTDGVVTGTVRAGEKIELGCFSIAAKAELRGDGNLATNFEPRRIGSFLREANEEEERRVRRWARQFFVHRGIAPNTLEKLDTSLDLVDLGDGDPLLVGSVTTTTYNARAGAVFFIARVADVTASKVVPQLALFSDRDSDSSDGVEPLFGLFDVDGDGLADLITRRSHKEGYDYMLYRRAGGRWRAFQGGGSGC
jgi:hypothetical protein